MWYEWNTENDFDTWHDELCKQLGYPLTGTNQLTSLPDEDGQKTTEYTNVTEVEGKWIAWVDDIYSGGLTKTDLRISYINPSDEINL
jgi:hypothetical protein